MRVLGYEVDEVTGTSACGTVRVGMPEDQLIPPHRWGDGKRHCWRVWVTMGEVTVSSRGDTLKEAEDAVLLCVERVHTASSSVVLKAKERDQ